jgi:hypothetical protein
MADLWIFGRNHLFSGRVMAPSPFDSTEIKVSLRDGHYLVLLNRVKDVVKEIDSVRNFSSL